AHNLFLACTMPHASDWLLAPPVPGLGLGMQSDVFRTALKFRLRMPLFDAPFHTHKAPMILLNSDVAWFCPRPSNLVLLLKNNGCETSTSGGVAKNVSDDVVTKQ